MFRGLIPCGACTFARRKDGLWESLFAGLVPNVNAGDYFNVGSVVGAIQPKLLALLPFNRAAGGV
jgi:hypothetical protein